MESEIRLAKKQPQCGGIVAMLAGAARDDSSGDSQGSKAQSIRC